MDISLWKKYGKAIVLFLAAVAIGARSVGLGDGNVSAGEALQFSMVLGTCVMTWLVPNFPQYPRLKSMTIVVMTILGIVVTTLSNWHVTGDEWVNLAIAICAAVLGIPAPSKSNTVSLRSRQPLEEYSTRRSEPTL